MDNRLNNLIEKHEERLKNSKEYEIFFKNKRNEKLENLYREKVKDGGLILTALIALRNIKIRIEEEGKGNGTRGM